MAYDLSIGVRKMHQTTVRFGADLWDALEEECARLGVSVAQYLREAALARMVYTAGRRGDDEFQLALELATAGQEPPARGRVRIDELEAVAAPALSIGSAHERAAPEGSEAGALAARGALVRRRAQKLRGRAEQERAQRERAQRERA